MYKLNIDPTEVHQTLGKHILADGFDLTFDLEKSKGVYIYDAKNKKKLLDFFTCFASVPLGYNHPKMLEDEAFKENLLLAALTNPSNSDIYTTQYAQFVDTFSRIGIPSYLPHAFFVAGGGLAIENALKTAMDWKVQKNFQKGYKEERGFQVLHFEHAFHGRTGYTLSLTNTHPDKTKWFNQQYMQQKSDSELAGLFVEILTKKGISSELSFVQKVVTTIKERAVFVSDFWELSNFFFEAPTEFDAKASKKSWKEDTPSLMNELIVNIKDSSVLSTIGVTELFYMTKGAASEYYLYFEAMLLAAIIYLFLTTTLSRFFNFLVHRKNKIKDYSFPSSQTVPEVEL